MYGTRTVCDNKLPNDEVNSWVGQGRPALRISYLVRYTSDSPTERGHASSFGLGQALLRVDNPHREQLGQQLLRHFYPELVARIQGLGRGSEREQPHARIRLPAAINPSGDFRREKC